MACRAVANIVKSSLGPAGLDKIPVDDIGDVIITNDGATTLKMLEVEHLAAKILVELAELQDRKVGDGTTSVVIVAAELLKRANDLVRNNIHPTSIISGYKLAMREACKYVEEKSAVKYFVEAGAIAVRRVRKEDMTHVAKATGATLVSTFADMEGEESFDSSLLGYADEIVEEHIADDDVTMIKGTKTTSAVSLILRGANDYMLDEMERALHDAQRSK